MGVSSSSNVKQGIPPARPGLYDQQSFLHKVIPFFTRFVTGQKSARGQYLTATFANANTPTNFSIALGHIPDKFIIVGAYVDGTVFASATNRAAWTTTTIVLQTAVPGQYALWVG